MQILLLLGHPNPDSFNYAIASACIEHLKSNGHTVLFHDLYKENFDPVHFLNKSRQSTNNLKKEHCRDLGNCDAIIVIHPNWWGQPPAIIKGWMDSVLLPGIAYKLELDEHGNYFPVGLLNATRALIITTSNTPNNIENDVLDKIWKNNVFNICGVNHVERINFGRIGKSSESDRILWLEELKQKLTLQFPTAN